MFNYSITFDSPWYLLLLGLLPLLWMWSYRSLAGLGRARRLVALGWRTLVMLLLILAVADMRLVRVSDRLTVIYLLDQSASIPREQRRAMVEYTRKSVEQHRDAVRRDRAAVIVFGRRPDIEIGPIDDDLPLAKQIETEVDQEFTDLEAAMKMALALFPEDAAKRVVIVTDGNENLGDAQRQASGLAAAGVGIDVVPIRISSLADVAVEKVTIPSDVRQGQPFDLRVVLNNNTPPDSEGGGVVKGRLRITRKAGDRETVLPEFDIELAPGKTVISTDKNSPETIRQADFYTYEARFIPTEASDDAEPENNRATAFTHVRGRGQVLLIEDWQNPGEFDHFVETLKDERLGVKVMTSDSLFTSLAELQRFDTVILANVPRSSGDEIQGVRNFSDEQIQMLVRNTEQMGSGLVMIGGANAFGVGGWTNTEIEKAMPVNFQIDNAKIAPVGALCLMMHAGEMADGNYWQRVIASESIKALGNQDYCSLIHWDWQTGGDSWLWANGFARVRNNRQKMLGRLDQMTPGDMPEFAPGMRKSAAAFARLKDAAVKHMIIISDGDPTPPLQRDIDLFKDQKPPVVITTVAVVSHGQWGAGTMKDIARQTGGKYYKVNNGKALPRIYQREVRRLARPLIYERAEGLQPRITGSHEMVQELTEPPPITGFVLTTKKEDPLVEISMVSPRPSGDRNNTILASWNYGLGRTVAFTTDTGETAQAWANKWKGWDDYKKLFSKIVRWSMRPVDESSSFLVATDAKDGKVRVMVNAWDKDDDFLDLLNMTGTVVGPDMQPLEIAVRQTAPGRYVGEFDAQDAGAYMVLLNPGRGRAPIRTGVNVPYSAEYRDRQANLSLLEDIAVLVPSGGAAGKLIEDEELSIDNESFVAKFNTFRHDLAKATSRQDIWYLLLMVAGCFFFFDVFFRRVQVDFTWMKPAMAGMRDYMMRREPVPVESETISRLRNRKAEVSDQIDQRRAAARFEPSPDAEVVGQAEGELSETGEAPSTRKPSQQMAPQAEQEEDTYTSRLLKAKKKVWEERDKK